MKTYILHIKVVRSKKSLESLKLELKTELKYDRFARRAREFAVYVIFKREEENLIINTRGNIWVVRNERLLGLNPVGLKRVASNITGSERGKGTDEEKGWFSSEARFSREQNRAAGHKPRIMAVDSPLCADHR